MGTVEGGGPEKLSSLYIVVGPGELQANMCTRIPGQRSEKKSEAGSRVSLR